MLTAVGVQPEPAVFGFPVRWLAVTTRMEQAVRSRYAAIDEPVGLSFFAENRSPPGEVSDTVFQYLS